MRDNQSASGVKAILVVEMNAGQMVEDVQLVVRERAPVYFYGRTGGAVPLPDEILDQILRLARLDGSLAPAKDRLDEVQGPTSTLMAA